MHPPRREWVSGNEIELLENGEEFFPALFAAIDEAGREVLLETYIWAEDSVGRELADRLTAAAGRGVAVRATVDGYGAPKFSDEFLGRLAAAGVEFCAFDSRRPFLYLIRMNWFGRMHRKLAVVDGRTAFIGGINIWEKHLEHFGKDSMQDYSVRVTGPIVERVHELVQRGPATVAPSRLRRWRTRLRRRDQSMGPGEDGARALLVTRDNRDHPNDIEKMYRDAIHVAGREVWIASAYFFPGYRLMREIARAARRGVDVRLILQGCPDVAISAIAESLLFDYLLAAGVRVFKYGERAMHAKVAVIDGRLATVGSSNLDPISLGLNLEANLFVLDPAFGGLLRDRLAELMDSSCDEVIVESHGHNGLRKFFSLALYHATRHMPRLGAWLTRRRQTVTVIGAEGSPEATQER